MTTRPEPLTNLAGAYRLVIHLPKPTSVSVGKSTLSLAPGRYAYCGSAYGPGGLRARIARHLNQTKTIRWHIDQLTGIGSVIHIYTEPGGHECAILQHLLAQPGVGVPIPRFGSSDCRTCPSHLVSLPPQFALGALTG